MAIDDIVRRIAEDAEAEAAAMVAAAEADAARTTSEAKERAAAASEATLARERTAAERDAQSLVSGARLGARDATLAARARLDAEVLAAAEAALLALPDGEYAALLARGVAASATGSERLLLGAADSGRLGAALPAALGSAGVRGLEIVAEPAGVEHGVVLAGDGVRVEISPASMIAERREQLLLLADRVLFGEEGV